ncbi:MAG TPA: VWA domain-containing protein [Thermoanaerobaculia bacterium]|nr:VWA domain-containing protein [Thermoanaerobaculia bacterium]
MKVLKSLLFLLTLPVSSLAQETRVTERVDVNVVRVDATVTDSRGNQILGLRKEDFIIRENGVEQSVETLDYFTNRRLLTANESSAAFKVEQVKEERYFIIFLQKPGSARYTADVIEARNAAIDFVEKELKPEDKVAIASYDVRLKLFSDFTSDKRALKAALLEAGRFSLGITSPQRDAPSPSILRNLDIAGMIGDTGRIYEAIELLANSVQSIPARKVLILFTPGVGTPSDFSPDIAENEDYLYRPMIRALNRANVTVFAINLLRSVRPHATEADVQRMATETGGEYFRTLVNFRTPLRTIENLNSGYYLLTYTSRKPAGSGGYQKIRVSLRNREFRVKARDGYPYGE